ncbi:MAG: HAD-IIIC family phosphatase [Bacteroidales bacterium]|jgi:FkbH-like protein|nr:HAD-IIIC family phosphatase [Bacteroidales bacterium]
MKYFVFRNATIERFFQFLPTGFSGYEDVSSVEEAERYIWFYLSPIAENEVAAQKVKHYVDLLQMTASKIGADKMLIVFTIKDIFNVKTVLSDNALADAVSYYNDALYELSKQSRNIKVIDFDDFCSRYPLIELIDWKFYFVSQMGLNPRLAADFGSWCSSQLNAIELKRKKVLVLDLDNTLWGGILGEDGIEGVALGGDYPGKAFSIFQHLILELSKQGVILAVCSKNNIEDVRQMWKLHPDVVLKEEYFASLRINWNNKADNIREIAEELNIGLDSFVFLDDNPTERELIKSYIPEVVVPDFPEKPYDLPMFFKDVAERYFSIYNITTEDKDKTQQYKENAVRATMHKSFTNMENYIRSLEIVLSIKDANDLTIVRASQMTQKTNQFNLTTHRYIDADLRQIINNEGKIFTLSVSDKFGNSGITGLCIIKIEGKNAEFDSFLLSCRVLGKDIEKAFAKYVLKTLQSEGIEQVKATYIPTIKNTQVADFYDRVGFTCLHSEDAIKNYIIDLRQQEIELSQNYRYL